MVREIKWTRRALSDLDNVYSFISKDSSRYARIQVEDIQNAVSNLVTFPFMGRTLPEFQSLPYRDVLVGNYRVIYRFKEKKNQILVMAIVHVRQLLKRPFC